MKCRKDIDYFLRKGDDNKYVDIYDLVIKDGIEYLCIFFGVGAKSHELGFLYDINGERKVVGIPINELRELAPAVKADDKFIAFINHNSYGARSRPDLFDIIIGRKEYPQTFNNKWDKFLMKQVNS